MARTLKEFNRSKCCGSRAKVVGIPDFIGDKAVCTVGYVCLKCYKPCDVDKIFELKKKKK